MNGEGGESIEALLGGRHPIVLAGMGGWRLRTGDGRHDAGGFGFLGMVRESVVRASAMPAS